MLMRAHARHEYSWRHYWVTATSPPHHSSLWTFHSEDNFSSSREALLSHNGQGLVNNLVWAAGQEVGLPTLLSTINIFCCSKEFAWKRTTGLHIMNSWHGDAYNCSTFLNYLTIMTLNYNLSHLIVCHYSIFLPLRHWFRVSMPFVRFQNAPPQILFDLRT